MLPPPRLAPFPPASGTRLPHAASGVALRALADADVPWLRDLYATTRDDELAHVPWPAAAKRAFLDQQFALQHAHYLAHYASSDFLAIEDAHGDRLGRYYLQRGEDAFHIVDICLFPGARGRGIGSALIRASQVQAAALGRGMALHVLHANPAARRLYERLGFAAAEASDTHLAMRWRAS